MDKKSSREQFMVKRTKKQKTYKLIKAKTIKNSL